MKQDWEPGVMVTANFCTISNAARQILIGQCVCLFEQGTGWETRLEDFTRPSELAGPPGFSIRYGDELIERIAARSAYDNTKLRDHILSECPVGAVKILIFYFRDNEPRLACCNFELEIRTFN